MAPSVDDEEGPAQSPGAQKQFSTSGKSTLWPPTAATNVCCSMCSRRGPQGASNCERWIRREVLYGKDKPPLYWSPSSRMRTCGSLSPARLPAWVRTAQALEVSLDSAGRAPPESAILRSTTYCSRPCCSINCPRWETEHIAGGAADSPSAPRF